MQLAHCQRGLYRIVLMDEFTIQMKTGTLFNVSNRKAKTSAIGLVFFSLWFILYIYYEVIKIILLGEAVGGKHVLECVLFTPLNEVSVIRGLGYAGHILERNRTAWQIPNRKQTELMMPLTTLGSMKEPEREILVSPQPHAHSKRPSHLQASSLQTP